MAMIVIDGINMPAPTSLKVPRFDLDSGDTARNEQGMLQRDRVRQGVFKLELEWKGITGSQLHTIESAIQPVSINVTFPTATGNVTKTMYVGDRSIEIGRYRSPEDIRWNVSFNLTEY